MSSSCINNKSAVALDEASLISLLDTYPLPFEGSSISSSAFHYEYGTAGFRYPSHLLPPVMVRMGLFASLRSYAWFSLPIGAMITASHNPAADNGIKVADVGYGRMLNDDNWENFAVQLVNAKTTQDALQILKQIFVEASKQRRQQPQQQQQQQQHAAVAVAVVHVGRDTRPSSSHLSTIFCHAAKSIFCDGGVRVVDHGIVTTPMLHFFVMYANSYTLPPCLFSAGVVATKGYTEEGYYTIIANAYVQLLRTKIHNNNAVIAASKKHITVDCACGVGSLKLERLIHHLDQLTSEDEFLPYTKFIIVNGAHCGPLNDTCGAEFVQKNQLPPKIYSDNEAGCSSTGRWCSLDGDADRIVFHYYDYSSCSNNNNYNNSITSKNQQQYRFCLLDGDKIAVLVALFIREELEHLLKCSNSSKNEHAIKDHQLFVAPRYGVVQTAYANGNSTAYLTDVAKIPVQIAKTGVKHVHACAEHHYDVGIYFEPNGHGTVLFSSVFYDFLTQMEQLLLLKGDIFSHMNTNEQERATIALQRLRLLPLLINQAVGDAISDLLLVEAILHLWGWDCEADDFHKWNSLYTELPSRQCKVTIQDRRIIEMNSNESQVFSPESLKNGLALAVLEAATRKDTSMKGMPRCFARPSGTEDVVRIYAEAPTQQEADDLAKTAATLVYKLCGGVNNDNCSVIKQPQSGL